MVSDQAKIGFGILLLVGVIITLGISVVTLVKVNKNNDKSSTDLANNPTTTTTNNVPTTTTTMGAVTTTSNVPSLNIPTPPMATPGPAYNRATQFFRDALDVSADPCNSFYEYACGKFTTEMHFDLIQDQAIVDIANKLNDPAYITDSSSSAMNQLSRYYKKCKTAYDSWPAPLGGNATIVAILDDFYQMTGLPFPMITGAAATLNPESLAKAIGYLSGSQMIDTLVTFGIDTNWRDPHGDQPYAALLDQPTLSQGNQIYRKAWDTYRQRTKDHFTQILQKIVAIYNVPMNPSQMETEIEALLDLELNLVINYSTDEETRRQYQRSYNPHSIAELQSKYSFLNWTVYLNTVSNLAPEVFTNVMMKPDFRLIVMETEQLTKLSRDISSIARDPTWINYFYLRLLLTNENLIPTMGKTMARIHPFQAKLAQRRRPFRAETPIRRPMMVRDDGPDDASLDCAFETLEVLQYLNARAYLDARFPSAESREQYREQVRKVISGILVAFRSQIDQLNWMSLATKMGAYSKIDNLVVNIGIPDFILDDNALNEYYKDLKIAETDEYMPMVRAVNQFNIKWYLLLLARTTGGADRLDFNGPPALVNAWYQPELNSITFPLAILQPPFFDPDGPAAVNYGAIGVVGGHELTHGFDDEGVQWDGTGVLATWMDEVSAVSFRKMADCVVQQYSHSCPLNASYNPRCIDGEQTQGENIADNGGIHAAFRAYRNYINLYGRDAQLPDALIGQLTQEQIYFLSFSLVWCSPPIDPDRIQRQLLLDVHSPYKYRVINTVANFPDFRNAFNCPLNSTNAPADHCNVWVSDVATATGVPPTTTTKPPLNIPTPAMPSNASQSEAYNISVSYFRASINTSADPCNDFYGYACGKYTNPISFTVVNQKNFRDQARQMQNPMYNAEGTPEALKKTLTFFKACQSARANYASLIANGSLVVQAITNFATATGLSFSMIETPGANNLTLPSSTVLGQAIGYLSDVGVDTLMTAFIDTNWKQSNGSKPYKFFIDQSTLFYPLTYYSEGAWANYTRANYRSTIVDLFRRYAALWNINLDNNTLYTDVESLMNFELLLARNFSTDDTTRRQFERNWNLYTLQTASTDFSSIDWSVYLSTVSAAAASSLNVSSLEFVIMEKEMLAGLSSAITSGNAFTATQLVNYLFFRLLAAQADFLPTITSMEMDSPLEYRIQRPLLGRPKRIHTPERSKRMGDTADDIAAGCAEETVHAMQYANARFFIDFLYPNASSRTNIREKAGAIIDNILMSFRNMLAELPWISDASRVGAYGKITNLVKNIAYPDFIVDNAQLDSYYSSLTFDANDGYFEMIKKLQRFNRLLQFQYLTKPAVERNDFLGAPGIVNAWYQPELNSITFPAGILQPPFFHPDWPASVNFGGLGLVAGHELTHGFDDQGVQWDGIGLLNTWMDANSSVAFQRMANCVIREYGTFCPLDSTQYNPNCVNGDQTQGENIADNGGIHAAFQSYRRQIGLYGPDQPIFDPLVGQFTTDQLFFLSFGQTWCRAPLTPAALYRQLMVDPHSPAEFRIFGTIQNYPEFRNAFNCPFNSSYAPEKHCNVWVLDNQ